MSSQIEDYPFNSWSSFYKAFGMSLETECWSEIYEKYDDALSKNQGIDLQIIKDFIEAGHDVREGFRGLCYAILNGYNFANEMEEHLSNCLDMFPGQELDQELYNAIYQNDTIYDDYNDEPDFIKYWPKGFLLQRFGVRYAPIDWDSIDPLDPETTTNKDVNPLAILKFIIKMK
jgi:hypothetical protein